MNKLKLILALGFCINILLVVKGQEYPKNYFGPPLDIPLHLTGTFGEIRSTHFHAGLDFRTQQRTGLRVISAGDGYISRIVVSTYGYGKGIYITHPNGYTTVYAHLEAFAPEVKKIVHDKHYEEKSFFLDFSLTPDILPVKKGDLIGFSGNTGGSRGAHLHFEIRDTKTEEAINPMLFGFDIKDTKKPNILTVRIYPQNTESSINSKKVPLDFKTILDGSKYTLSNNVIRASGVIGVAAEVFDYQDATTFKNGIYSMELFVNGINIFKLELDKFTFEEGKYVNEHTDYEQKFLHDRKIQKLFHRHNDDLSIYKKVVNRGLLNIKPDSSYSCRLIVKDAYGNASEVSFVIKGENPIITNDIREVRPLAIPFHRFTFHKEEGLALVFPENGVFDTTYLSISKRQRPFGYPEYRILPELIVMKKPFNVGIELKPEHLPFKDKFVVIYSGEHSKPRSIGGTYLKGYVTAEHNRTGYFTLEIDTIAPKITPVNISNGKSMSGVNQIKFNVSDNLSGISNFMVKINDEFHLFEYEHKENLIYGDIKNLAAGKHTLTIKVWDEVKNENIMNFEFLK